MKSIGPPRVLIVEDDPDLLVILRVNLASEGLEPILAGDGRTAIDRILAERPDAVLLDVMLPGIDGWQVLEELHEMGDPVPVVVCSAKKHADDVARAEAFGAAGYVTKPFDIEELLDVVTAAVGRRRDGVIGSVAQPELGIEGLDLA